MWLPFTHIPQGVAQAQRALKGPGLSSQPLTFCGSLGGWCLTIMEADRKVPKILIGLPRPVNSWSEALESGTAQFSVPETGGPLLSLKGHKNTVVILGQRFS